MAHTNPSDGANRDRRGFIGLILTGVAALVGWQWLRDLFGSDATVQPDVDVAGTTITSPTSTDAPSTSQAAASSSTDATTSTVTTRPTTTTEAATGTTTSPAGNASSTTTTTRAPSTTGSTTSTSSASTTTTTTSNATLGIAMIEKKAWSDTPEGSGYVSHDQITDITIHHTAVVLDDNRDAPARFRQHEAYHRSQGFADIAYHMLIDRAGNVYEGRPIWSVGETFTNYDPAGHFLPVLEGDFNSQQPTDAQLESLAIVTAWALDYYGLRFDSIAGHKDLAATSCPGSALYSWITSASFRRRVLDIAAGGVELILVEGSAAASIVAEVEAG